MSELTFNLLRLGYLLLLWVFVLSAVAVLRRDISIRGRSAASSGENAAGAWATPTATAATAEPLGALSTMAAESPLPPAGGPAPIVVGPAAAAVPQPVPPGPAPIVVGPGAPTMPTAPTPSAPPAPPEPIVVAPKARCLAIDTGALAGTVIPLSGQPITIGRAAGNTLVLDDDYASSHHARIFPGPEGWILEDLNSTNGTFVAGEPLAGATVLPVETPVTIGHSTLRLVV